MDIYIIANWLSYVNRALPRDKWATKLIEARFPQLQIEKAVSGKPYILQQQIFINWSHNERYLVVAFSDVGELGVDMENYTIPYDEELHSWVLHKEEKKRLVDTSFAEIWTRKEAILKWTGEGLIESLDELNSYAVDAAVASFRIGDVCISVCSERPEEVVFFYGDEAHATL